MKRAWGVLFCLAGLAQDRHAVTWTTPSANSSGSMPLGNGDLALNVWTEPSGDIVFYVSKSDAWSENLRMLKLGRVRVKLDPPLATGAGFRQTLKPEQSLIEIAGGGALATVWVDAHLPVARVEVKCETPCAVRAALESWRDKPRRMGKEEIHSAYGFDGGPDPLFTETDTVLPAKDNRVVWYHRNERSPWAGILKHQGLGAFAEKAKDPLLGVTFGGALAPLHSMAARTHLVQVHALTAQTASAAEWLARLEARVRQNNSFPVNALKKAHLEWWKEFWSRSWIRVSGVADAESATEGYALQRFINAAAGRGAYPVKFNGSLFNVDGEEKGLRYDADYRRWGGPYWFQNTRLPYWAMVTAGDWDLMRPLFEMFKDALPLAQERTRVYFNAEGASFPETMYFFGAYANSNYGWKREGKHPSYVENTYIRHYFSGGIELVALMLDRASVTQDREFVRETLLPLTRPILKFYATRFPRDRAGRLVIKPAGALETYSEVVNPAPEVAGLRFVLPRLLQLPRDWTAAEQREFFQTLLVALPDLPLGEKDGKKVVLRAAETISKRQNRENPELYAVFPYRLFGLGKPDLDIGRATYEARDFRETGGWQQDSIQAALLGLTQEARKMVAHNFSTKNPRMRFPAFWGPNFDWTPDQDHGNVAMIAMQRMLLQFEGDRMTLFPAWPKEWDVEFRLWGPRRTSVEGIWRGGKLEKLTVTPEARRKDLTIGEPQ